MKKLLIFMVTAVFCLMAMACGEEETSFVDGMVVSYNKVTLEIAADDLENYLFTLEEPEIEGEEYAITGNSVRVQYKGTIKPLTRNQDVEVTELTFTESVSANEEPTETEGEENNTSETDSEEDNSTPAESSENTDNIDNTETEENGNQETGSGTVEGIVQEVTAETIVLETDSGTYTFNIEETEINSDDINIGDSLMVTYTGTLTPEDEITAASIEKK